MLQNDLITDGQLRLSYAKASRLVQQEAVREAVESGKPLQGKITEVVKGGFIVDVGMRGFVPASQMDDQHIENMKAFIGQTFDFRVIEHDLPNGKLVLSRKALLKEASAARRKDFLAGLAEGQRHMGTIKRIMDYGVFVDLGGIEGLLHISEMSWRRIKNPSELFKVGDQVEVDILKFDREKKRISLGYRKDVDDPWIKASELFGEGTVVRGTVQKLEPYGAFIELESGIQGLIPISEMSWTKRLNHPNQLLKIGDLVEAVVTRLDLTSRKMSLSLKQITEHPWEAFARNHPAGIILQGKITRAADFGLFVELADGVEGLVHISEIADVASKVNLDSYKEGQEIKVKVLNVDLAGKKISLSIKAIVDDEAQEIIKDYMDKGNQPSGHSMGDKFPEALRSKLQDLE
jgi:small subunit ribosomal protein S1